MQTPFRNDRRTQRRQIVSSLGNWRAGRRAVHSGLWSSARAFTMGRMPFQCPVCELLFRLENELEQHLKDEHPDFRRDKPYES